MFGIHHNSCNFLDHFFVAGFVGSSPCVVNVSVLSRSVVSDSATSWIVAHLPPLSMGFSRQEYWSGLPFSSPGHLPNPGIEAGSLALQADSLLGKKSRKEKVQMFFTYLYKMTVNHMRSTFKDVVLCFKASTSIFNVTPFNGVNCHL